MAWVNLSSVKKVKYLGNKAILMEFKRGNASPLRLRMQYATIFLLHHLHGDHPVTDLIDVAQPNGIRFKRLQVGNGFRFKKMTAEGEEIWLSPFFNAVEMSGLIEYIRTLPAINTSEYIALVIE